MYILKLNNVFYNLIKKAEKDSDDKILLNELEIELSKKGYQTSIATEEVIYDWINKYIPNVIHDQIVQQKSLKQCGGVSTFIAGLLAKDGITAGIVEEPGHFVLIIPTQNGNSIRLDATHLQFKQSKGGLRDFSPDERESDEYKQMKQLFEDLKKDPMKAVSIEKQKGVPENMRPPPALSQLFNPKVYGPDWEGWDL